MFTGEPFTLKIELNNTGFGPLVNGTFWLEGEGFRATPEEVQVAELGVNNTTTLKFTVRPELTGNISIELEGSFRPLLINGTPERLLSELAPAVIHLNVKMANDGLPGWSLSLTLLALALGWVVMQATPVERRGERGSLPTQD